MTDAPETPRGTEASTRGFVLRLPGVVNRDASLTRGLPPKVQALDPVFWEHFDSDTIAYAAGWLPGKGVVRLYCPKLVDFEPLVAAAHYSAPGRTLSFGRIRRNRRFDTVDIRADGPIDRLEIALPGQADTLDVVRDVAGRFAGLNCLYTMSKDNDLDWIEDWARFHVASQGVNGVLLADNGSAAYTPEEILARLLRVPGLRQAGVISAPFRFGRTVGTNAGGRIKMVQPAMQNLARETYLSAARGVISCDVDELVVSRSDRTVFDAVETSLLGTITFPGVWRYAPKTNRRPRHADHVLARVPEEPSPSKYVTRPGRRLGRLNWDCHSLQGINRKLLMTDGDFYFLHCHSISTSWKFDRTETEGADRLVPDEVTRRIMAACLPEG